MLAEKVVIASNAYTEGEWTELRRNFFPGYYYQVASAPLTEEAAQRILPGGQGEKSRFTFSDDEGWGKI